MRLYLLRNPVALLIVGALAVADAAYRLLLRECVRSSLIDPH